MNSPSNATNPIATITFTDGKVITLELFPDKAPNTVNNFIYLANEKKLYDGVIFHRVIPGFMIQGGDPLGNGTGGPGYSIKGEMSHNGFAQNDISHVKGVISMGRRSGDFNSAGCQFFICVADYKYGDGEYAAFGRVLSGQDVADAISQVKRDGSDRPLTPVTIQTIRVDTKGVDYPKPEMITR